MLTAQEIVNVAAPLVDLWATVEQDIVSDITRRLVKGIEATPTAEWQIMKLRAMGVLQTDIAQQLARATRRNEKDLYQAIVRACRDALAFDDALYVKAGYTPMPITESRALMDIIAAGAKKTAGLMQNFTGTLAKDGTRAFSGALDRAWLQVQTGAFTREQALAQAVKDLSRRGIRDIAYPSGHADKVDVAARRAIVTGLNQTAAECQLARMDEMGCDLVEVTSHAGARPSHAVWQGQVYSRSGRHPQYKDFYDETGYGTGEGLCGWNCYHSFFPFFEGLSHQAFERDPAARLGKSNDQVYEESQRQRYYERQIRESKRECSAIDAARSATTDPTLKAQLDGEFTKASVKLKSREAKLDAFCRETGRTKLNERASVAGFGRSEASKASWAVRKIVETPATDLMTRRRIGANGQEIIDKATYNKLTRSFVNGGGLIVRGALAEEHLAKMDAYASYIVGGNMAFIRDDATVSDVIEEMLHARQDRANRFGSQFTAEVRLRREIEAQKYLIRVADKYKIPIEEQRVTLRNLRDYETALKKLTEGGR